MASKKPQTQEQLTGLDKASVILLSLDEQSSMEVLKLLDEREIQRLTGHASRIKALNTELINSVRQEFLAKVMDSSPLLIRQAREQLKQVLQKILPPERYNKFV